MDAECKTLLDKYIRSDSAISCLELSGYTSALLIRNIDNNQINQIEEFVRHACTLMTPANAGNYLGSLFTLHPNKFCFPIGVRMGIMLAVEELKNGSCKRDIAVQTDPSVLVVRTMKKDASNGSIDLTTDDDSPSLNICSKESLSDSYSSQMSHLKEHSSASVVRLVSRQFVNARLIPDEHFHIEMEIVASSSSGQPRITGIFHCHLCREKKTRAAAVRFSVSRNRYPIMSNVLSHLKTHFQPLTASAAATNATTVAVATTSPLSYSPVKRENTACSESSTGIDSLSPFNLDHILPNNVFLSSEFKY